MIAPRPSRQTVCVTLLLSGVGEGKRVKEINSLVKHIDELSVLAEFSFDILGISEIKLDESRNQVTNFSVVT